MGLFSNREGKRQENQKPAPRQEFSQHQREEEKLIQLFDAGIKSLEPVFTEAVGLGVTGGTFGGMTIQQVLLSDLTGMVVGIARTKHAHYLSNEAHTAASLAFSILRRVARAQLQAAVTLDKYELVCQNMMANSEAPTFRIDNPLGGFGILAVMKVYDGNFGTSHAYMVADLFLALALALEAIPELKGSRILIAYVSALRAFVEERPKPSDPFAEVTPRTTEAYETIAPTKS